MGEVGANASETSASADQKGSREPKENGELVVNGTTEDDGQAMAAADAETPAADGEEPPPAQKKRDSAPQTDTRVEDEEITAEKDTTGVTDGTGKDTVSSTDKTVHEEEQADESDDATEKDTPAPAESDAIVEKSKSLSVTATEASSNKDDRTSAEATTGREEKSPTKSNDSGGGVAKGNHLAGTASVEDVSTAVESAPSPNDDDNEEEQQAVVTKSPKASNGKSVVTPPRKTQEHSSVIKEDKEAAAMEVDHQEDRAGEETEVAKSPSLKDPQNGGGQKEAAAVCSPENSSKAKPKAEVLTCDDEPMEVDDGDLLAATNGHKEAVDGSEERPVKETAASRNETSESVDSGKKQSTVVSASSSAVPTEKNNEEEEDDDKPVSINSDSDSEETPERGAPAASTTTSTSIPKPSTNNVSALGEDGVDKALANAGTAAVQQLPIGNGETTISIASSAKSSASNASNGIQLAASAAAAAASVATGNQNGDCDGDVTILSDKEEDCVVIEDDDDDELDSDTTPATPVTTPTTASARRGARSKRTLLGAGGSLSSSMVADPLALAMQHSKQQQHLQHLDDDDDDDVEEIIDDPLDSGMPMGKGVMSGTTLGRPSMMGQYAAGSLKGSSQKSLLMNSPGTTASGGKEPTLVIIDTNTLANNNGIGRTATSMVGGSPGNSPLLGKAPVGMLGNNVPGSVGVNSLAGAQFNSRSLLNSPGTLNSAAVPGGGNIMGGGMLGKTNASALAPVTPLLPALTDDMFVLEAPSFIVPYIYEKPPVDNLRDILDELEEEIKEMRKKLEESGAVPSATEKSAAPLQESPDQPGAASGRDGGDASKKQDHESADAEKEPDNKKRKRNNDDDDEWDELDTSTDDEASDEEQKTKVLIKEARADIEAIKEHIISPLDKDDLTGGDSKKQSENYFENPLGKFFMNIGINQVQEFVQTDLLRQQKRKRDREGKPSPSTQMAINSLMKNLEQSKENNKPYKFEMKRCEYCPFKSESALVMAHHYETPHMRNFIYKCNFCSYETRPPHDILYHMEAVHNIKGRMEKALSYHHCPNCPFEDNGKSKLARHAVACAKKFRPEINLNPPLDWEPPAKIPRIKPKHGLVGTATAYQAMTAQQQKNLALANQQRLNQQQQQQHQQQQQQQTVSPVAIHTAGGLLTHQQIQQQQVAGAAAAAAAAAAMNLSGLAGTGVGGLNNMNLANLSPAAQAAAIRARAGAGIGGNVSGAGLGVGRAPAIISSPTGITAVTAGGIRTGAGAAGLGGATGPGGLSANALATTAAAAAAIRNTLAGAGMVIPNNLQLSASALAAAAAAGGFNKFLPNSVNAGRSLLSNSNASITIQNASSMKTTKTAQPPSISITPLPRQSASGNGGAGTGNSSSNASNLSNIAGTLSKLQAQGTSAIKPGQNPSGGKTAFVVCEICDGYIKDLDQLRNHMQWIHKVKIHPKMIYNRPPLNCQKCQYRFFTDQGLERHLLGSHGLVTSSMQEAANKGKDAGRCPVCGRVYQWKLLNHVSRDHNMTLKPAHLSYKCTVCTATFGMYKQFESHVYSAHSTVAKKSVDGKGKGGGGGGGQQTGSNMGATSSSGMGRGGSSFGGGNDSLLKPLKINDEITIIPQPTSNSSKMAKTIELESHVID